MKHSCLLFFFLISVSFSFSQATRFYSDPLESFKLAKEQFQKEQYSLAANVFSDLMHSYKETDRINNDIVYQEIKYYHIVCELKQQIQTAEDKAVAYIELEKNNPRTQMMNFHLGDYYYKQQNFAKAVQHFEQTNIANLSNAEILKMKFESGYAYFTLQQFEKAKPLLNTIRQMKEDENYLDANYYYGFIAFRDRNYRDALQSFIVVENHQTYAGIVPYYIAQIYYIQGQKEKAISYAENKIKTGKSQYYDLELKQLLGHAYFEKKEYDKALPFLEDFVNKSTKVRREDLYELSYAHYQAKQYAKAIDGFKQLSGKEDSLSQHAMYLLGDSYLKTDQKSNARNAFLFSSNNSSNLTQREISKFSYAKLSFELGYQDEALNGFKSFLNEFPASSLHTEAKELLVTVLTNTNNYRDALTLLETLNSPSPNAKRLYPRILYGRSTELINDGRLNEANSLLDKALRDANNGSVLPFLNFWKGEIAYRTMDLDNAIRYYQTYLSLGAPSNAEVNSLNVRYNLGYSYLRKENYKLALNFFEQVIRNPVLNENKISQDAFLRSADCYYMNKDYTKARSMYETVIRFSWPSEDYATYQSAMIAGIKNPTEKINLLNTLNRKFPRSGIVKDATLEIAMTYLSEEKFSEAIPYLNSLVKEPGNESYKPGAYLKLGLAYYNLNNNKEALNNYKTVVTQYPNSEEADDAVLSIKSIFMEDGKAAEYADFMRQSGRTLSVSTEDSLIFISADYLYRDGKVNDALNGFNNYIKKFPNGTYLLDANFYAAEIYLNRKENAHALKGFEFVASRAPNKFAERASLQAARLNFFEIKNYVSAEIYYRQLKDLTNNQEAKLEAMRGLLRSQYQLAKWNEALENAKELVNLKGSSTDDKALASMAMAKSYQVNGQYDLAIGNYKSVITLNKAALAAEARFEISRSWFELAKYPDAEKAAFEVINKSGSYDYWVTKAYILLGDIYYKQKDYFNAKATYRSVVDNSTIAELKNEAKAKLDKVTEEEAKTSKING